MGQGFTKESLWNTPVKGLITEAKNLKASLRVLDNNWPHLEGQQARMLSHITFHIRQLEMIQKELIRKRAKVRVTVKPANYKIDVIKQRIADAIRAKSLMPPPIARKIKKTAKILKFRPKHMRPH